MVRQGVSVRSGHLRGVMLVAAALALVGACDRPHYEYSTDVPIAGSAVGGSPFGGASAVGGTFGTAGAPVDSCTLDRVSTGTIFAKQAVSNQLPARSELFAELTDAEVSALKRGASLLPPVAASPTILQSVLAATSAKLPQTDTRRALLSELGARFKSTRALWANPWALRLVEHAGSEHMNPVRVTLKRSAWIVRIVDGGLPVVVDMNNVDVAAEDAALAPDRIAGVYYVYDNRLAGNTDAQCDVGKREFALGNEALVEEFAIGTEEIAQRLDDDIDALTAFFNVVRPCSTVERAGSFHSYTVCQTWRFFDVSTEYSAYQWALANPVELYKPKAQNLASLIEALKNDRFEPGPFVGRPQPNGGDGGAGGLGGAPGLGGEPGVGGAGGAP